MIPDTVARFVARELEGRSWRWSGESLLVEPGPPDPRIEELARDDCFFAGEPRIAIRWSPDGAILHWTNDHAARELGVLRIRPEEASDRVCALVDVPTDHALLPDVHPARKFAGHLWTVEWSRELDGVPVSGDYVSAMLNSTTGRLASFSRSEWGPLPEFGPGVLEEEAIRVADAWVAANAAPARRSAAPKRYIVAGPGGYTRIWELWYDYRRPTTPGEREEWRQQVPGRAPDECTVEPPGDPPETRTVFAIVRVDDRGAIAEARVDP